VPCDPDPLEGDTGNDTPALAAAVGPGPASPVICPADEDWLSLAVPAGAHLSVGGAAEGVDPLLWTLRLHGADGALLAEAEAADGARRLEIDLDAVGPYLLHLAAPDYGAAVHVQLVVRVEAQPDAPALACAQAELLELPAVAPLTPHLPAARLPTSCAAGAGQQHHALRFQLAEPAVVDVQTQGATALALRSDCAAVETEAACRVGAEPSLEEISLEAGTWTLIVHLPQGASGSVDVFADGLPLVCAAVERLLPGGWEAGSTVEGSEQLWGSCGGFPFLQSAPEVIHRIELAEPAWVTLELSTDGFEPALYVLDECSREAQELGCRTGAGALELPVVQPGTLWVAVDGVDGAAGGYELRATLAEPLAALGGDTCADRHPLEPAADSGRATVQGTTVGREDSFDVTAFCWNAGPGPDTTFSLPLAAPADVRATLRPYNGAAAIYLIEPDCHGGRGFVPWPPELGHAAACEYANDVPWTLDASGLSAGDHTLVVDADDAGAPFDLQVEVLESGCLLAPELVPGQPLEVDTAPELNRFADPCGGDPGPDSPEALLRVELEVPSRVVVGFDELPAFAPQLSLRSVCRRQAQPLACVRGSELVVDELPPGTYWVAVESADGAAGPARVVLEVQPEPRAAKCSLARPLTFVGGTASASGGAHVSTRESALFAPQGCQGTDAAEAPEALFSFSLDAPASLDVAVLRSNAPVVTYVLGAACPDGPELACGEGDAPIEELALPAGDYTLVVDGAESDGPGGFELRLSLE